TDTGFEVGMSFGGIPERLAVTFASIKEFVDPSVPFGMKFESLAEPAAAEATAPATSAAAPAAAPAAEPKPTPAAPGIGGAPPTTSPTPGARSDDGPHTPAGGGEVVRLDRFRKK